MGWAESHDIILERRLLGAHLYVPNFEHLVPVVDDATVDVLGMCLYASPLRSVGICHYYMLPDFRKGTIIFISA